MEIFAQDEMELKAIDPSWDEAAILAQDGVFYLKDLAKALAFDPASAKRRARELDSQGKNAWEDIGVRKLWSHWVVRMTRFAGFYRDSLKSWVNKVNPEWDGNQLLHQSGCYFLADVCKLLPFAPTQLRHQARNNPDAKEVWGHLERGKPQQMGGGYA